MTKRIFTLIAIMILGVSPAFAHLAPGEHGSFATGFTHPIFGADHVLAMLAVGVWASQIGGRANWLVPTGFVTAMLAGFGLSLLGVPLPFVEPAILASVVALGLVIAFAVRPPLMLGVVAVAGFALFHGYAHGGEMGAATAWPYATGFAAATALLHAIGVAAGLALTKIGIGRTGQSAIVTRALGGATVLAGMGLIFS